MRGTLALLAALILVAGSARPVAGDGPALTVWMPERRVPPSPATGAPIPGSSVVQRVSAPTPRSPGWASHCEGCWPPGRWGAVRSWRWGDVRYSVKVCSTDGCVTVTVRDYCACGPRHGTPTVIDLSPEAWDKLVPDGRRHDQAGDQGIVRVSVRLVDGRSGPSPTLPPTDTE